MPHDRKNRELKPGDRVILEGVVKEAYAGQAVCNLVVQPAFALADPAAFGEEGAAWRNQEANWKGPVTFCAHWVEKLEDAPAAVLGSAKEPGMGDVAS